MLAVGTLDQGVLARVDDAGRVVAGDAALEVWVGADDRWHVLAEDVGVRHARVGPAPVAQTRVRVPGGDAVQHVYAADGRVVVEVHDDSPAPFAVAFVVRAGDVGRARTVEAAGAVVRIDGVPVLVFPRAPFRWSVAVGASVRDEVCSGAAREGSFPATTGRAVEAAFLFPVAHRTRTRAVFAPRDDAVANLDVPDLGTVRRAWDRLLDRGMRTELPEPLQSEVDAARADLLLAGPGAGTFVALEAWGFDEEAAAVWHRLGIRDRRRARRRDVPRSLLLDTRGALVREHDSRVEVLPGLRPEWLGQPVAVHDAPLRAGRCSFAVRWHGPRPALLWDAPPGVELRAPALDATWSSREPQGETLLAAPPAPLLAMGTSTRAGERVEPPDSFS